MTSFLDVDFYDDSQRRLASRKYVVLATTRFDERFRNFFKVAASSDDVTARWNYLIEDIRTIVASAADELGYEPTESENASLTKTLFARAQEAPGFEPWPGAHTASVHEARGRVKMCPFHKDVVDISLADGNPSAGFSAMSQHWGGERHCEGDGYKGDKCNFKPQMTTQSFWDERKEKADQRRQEREQAAELEAQQPVDETPVDTPENEVEAPVDNEVSEPVEVDNVVEVDFGGAEAPEAEVPMSMAASTKTADGTPVPKMDKRKWTPQTVKRIDADDADGPHPTKHKDVVAPIKADNNSKPSEIGEQETERQDVGKDSDYAGSEQRNEQGGSWSEGPKTAVSAHDPYKNELVEIVKNDFDGFLPANEVQQALLAHRNR